MNKKNKKKEENDFWLYAYEGLVDDVFSSHTYKEARAKLLSLVLPNAKNVLDKKKYRKLEIYVKKRLEVLNE